MSLHLSTRPGDLRSLMSKNPHPEDRQGHSDNCPEYNHSLIMWLIKCVPKMAQLRFIIFSNISFKKVASERENVLRF